jgi:ABC-type transport system involved in cytochrome bd biosynthesis fused ATPase/permease subunit
MGCQVDIAIAGIQIYAQPILTGMILIGAVYYDRLFALRRARIAGLQPQNAWVSCDERNLALRAIGLGKTNGPTNALADASIQLQNGEVRSVVGAMGAGKSTLIKILTGAIRPTSGEIEIEGRKVEPGDPVRMLRLASPASTSIPTWHRP